MAERYRREKGLPSFQPADLSGFFAGAQETGRQAAAVGQQAAALGQQARVIEEVGQQAVRYGAQLARQHGEQKVVGPMRDSDGNMVPLVQRLSLNISDQVYQERETKAWHAEALNAYKEASEAEAQKHRTNPQGYAEAMTEVREQILSAAPGSLSGVLETQLQDFSLGVRSGIEGLVAKNDRRRSDLAIEQNIDRSHSSLSAAIIRDPDSIWVGGQPNPELFGEDSDIFQAKDSVSAFSAMEDPEGEFAPQHRSFADSVARTVMYSWFAGKASGTRQTFSDNPSDAQNAVMEFKRMVEDDEIAVPGWPGKVSEGMGAVKFSQLPLQEQEKLRAQMSRLSQRVVAESEFRLNYKHEKFQERVADSMLEVNDAIPPPIQSQDLRNHVEQWSGARGVDPALSYAMIWRESNNGTRMLSPTGVQGMMQVTHKTGKAMAERIGETYDPDRSNSYSSTKYGITYLGHLLRKSEEWCPHCNPIQREYLASATYNQGPRVISELRKRGADLSNPQQWLPVLKDIVIKDKQGKIVFDGPQASNHAEKVMKSRLAMTSGGAAVFASVSEKAAGEFQNPLQYMRAMNRFHNNWTHANSMKVFNSRLTYTPPAFDADMARAFVDDQWKNLYNPNTPNPGLMAESTAKSIVKMVQGDTEYGHRVQMEAYARANSVMQKGNTKQAQKAQQLMNAHGGSRHTENDAELFDKQLPGGPHAKVLDWFREGVNSGEDMVSATMGRHRLGGHKTNGRLNAETMTLTDMGLRALATNNMTEDQVKQFTTTLDLLYGGARKGRGHLFSPEVQEQMQAVWTSRENLSRMRPGPSENGASMLAAVDFARENGHLLAKGDPEAQQSLYRILHGQPPKESWEAKSVDTQHALNSAIDREIIDGLPSFRTQMVEGILPSYANVTTRAGQIILNEVMRMRPMIDKDNVGSSFEYGKESALTRGLIGYSRLTYDDGVVGNEGSDTTKNMFVENPVEMDMNIYSAVKMEQYEQFKNVQIATRDGTGFEPLTVEIPTGRRNRKGEMIMETVPAERGTIFGAMQAAFDDIGEKVDVAKEFKAGNLLMFRAHSTRSPGGRPAAVLQVMKRVRISGMEGEGAGEWRQAVAFDTGEMEDIAATPKYMAVHKQATALAAPWFDVSALMANLPGGQFRYDEANYGEGWLERELRPLGAALSGAALGISPLTRGLFESEELPERLQVNPEELPE